MISLVGWAGFIKPNINFTTFAIANGKRLPTISDAPFRKLPECVGWAGFIKPNINFTIFATVNGRCLPTISDALLRKLPKGEM